jgi:hypothetical protein
MEGFLIPKTFTVLAKVSIRDHVLITEPFAGIAGDAVVPAAAGAGRSVVAGGPAGPGAGPDRSSYQATVIIDMLKPPGTVTADTSP